ncbi:MAG: TRAP transporter small permease [Peptoniphilus sp.]|nr:TRAP transporter small permease [Peptoniphilus sp.]
MIKKINKIIREIEIWIIVIGLALMTLATLYNVFNRFIFKVPITWTDEFTRYLLVWVTLIGAAIGVTERSHATVSFIVEKFPEKQQKFIKILAIICCLLLCVIFIVGGIILSSAQKNQISPGLHISMAYVYISIPVSFTLMLIAFIDQGIDIYLDRKLELEDVTEVII